MLVAVIQVEHVGDIPEKVNKAGDLCDAIELRLDAIEKVDIDALITVRKKIEKPVIFTLRPASDGGEYYGSEQSRLVLIEKLSEVMPDYIDLEHHVSNEFIDDLHSQHPKIKIIRSYHNFNKTPDDLDEVLSSMQHSASSIYKIATKANSILDSLRMLEFVKAASANHIIASHCMGHFGIPTRILGKIVGSAIQYASIDGENIPAPGCLSLKQYCHDYRYHELSHATKMYGLIGDPVKQSVGHQFHNALFHKHKINAVYVKFSVGKDEVFDFFKKINDLPFLGLSVTMPLKMATIPHMNITDDLVKKIGALNTIRIDDDVLTATNTDGQGALTAIEKKAKVKSKSMLIIGAGGAARAIAFEAKQRGVASIVIINRTFSRAQEIACELDGVAYDFDSAKNADLKPYDFVINTIALDINETNKIVKAVTPCFDANTIFMDINYHQPLEALMKIAIEKECEVVDGHEMFVEQGLLQQEYWKLN